MCIFIKAEITFYIAPPLGRYVMHKKIHDAEFSEVPPEKCANSAQGRWRYVQNFPKIQTIAIEILFSALNIAKSHSVSSVNRNYVQFD
jgi:hypothetical protein